MPPPRAPRDAPPPALALGFPSLIVRSLSVPRLPASEGSGGPASSAPAPPRERVAPSPPPPPPPRRDAFAGSCMVFAGLGLLPLLQATWRLWAALEWTALAGLYWACRGVAAAPGAGAFVSATLLAPVHVTPSI